MRHRREPAVRAKLAVDVMQVIAQGMRRDVEPSRDGCGVAALREETKDATLLRGQRLDWRRIRRDLREGDDLARGLQQSRRDLLPSAPITDVARQANKEPLPGSRIVVYDRGHADPDPFTRTGAHVQVEMWDATVRAISFRRTGGRARSTGERRRAQII